jgi:cytochrome c553
MTMKELTTMTGPRPTLSCASIFLCVAAALGLAPAFAQSPAPAAVSADVRAVLALAGDPARGQSAFETCVPCHRRDAAGRANGSVPRLSGQHASVIVKQILDIRSGLRLNPSMKAVLDEKAPTPQAIADIAAYLQGLPLAGSLGKGPGTGVERGQALYAKDCASCHGAAGEGDAAAFVPMVASQHHVYLQQELELIRNGERGNSNPEMVARLKPHAAGDLQALADFMAQLPAPKR